MVNEPRRDGPDSRLCPSCGTRLSKPTNFCPECGAKQLAAVSQAAAGNDAGADRSGTPYHALVSVAAFAIVFAALGISHHGQQERTPQVPPAQRAAIGEVQVFAVAPASASNSTTPSVLASMRPNSPLPGQLEQLAAAQHTHAQEDLVGTRQDNVASHTRVAGNLSRARASLERNSLWPARRDIMIALAEQPGNGEAQQMRAELVARERERESLLAYARLCARGGQWVCARHNAAHAVSVDASSRTARRLLSRAIAEQPPDPAENDELRPSRAIENP